MKIFKCENCGSSSFSEQNELYVCQNCGTKYTKEQTGSFTVNGTVKIDNTDNISKYLKAARTARAQENSEDAKKYYEMVTIDDPNNGEAAFFYKYYTLECCANKDIAYEFRSLCSVVSSSVNNIAESDVDVDEKMKILADIALAFIPKTWTLNRYMNSLTVKSGNTTTRVLPANDISSVGTNGILTLYKLGDEIERAFADNEKAKTISAEAWKEGVLLQQKWYAMISDKTLPEKYAAKIKAIDSSYEMPKKAGCISFADKR